MIEREFIGPPETTTAACQAHESHRPRPHVNEFHHVVPRAWQAFWQPPNARPLWAPHTVPLCPSGHRNVHWWLVRMMGVVINNDITEAAQEARRGVRGGPTSEQVIAVDGMRAFHEAGGDLQALKAAGLLGYA